jgi:hypothetical protein
MLSPQGPQWSRHSVARVRRRDDRPPSRKNGNGLSGKYREQEILIFYQCKFEWESPPSILVTRNPNWSQR